MWPIRPSGSRSRTSVSTGWRDSAANVSGPTNRVADGVSRTTTSAPSARRQPEQLDRLVGGDRAGDAERDEPAREAPGRRRRPLRRVIGSPSSSGSPPATSAWRIARPLRVRSGSIASTPSIARAHGAADRPPVRIDADVARLDVGRVRELAPDPREQPVDQRLVAEDRAALDRARRCPARSPGPALAARPAAAWRSAPRALPGRARGPGAIAPPTNAPSAATQSKVVAVPKSTTTAGVPYSRAAARALTSRSAPTSAGRSTRIAIGTVRPRRRAAAARAAPRLSRAPRSAPERRSRTRSPRRRRTTRRRAGAGVEQLLELVGGGAGVGRRAADRGQGAVAEQAVVTFVLPMSTARSIGDDTGRRTEREPCVP